MINNFKLSLNVNRDKKEIQVEAVINFLGRVNRLKLILNEGLVISRVIDESGRELSFHEELNANAMFIKSSKRVTLEIPEGTNSITMIYSGEISGWHNIISDDYVALNFYSAWYPIFENYDMSIIKNVTIKNISDLTVIKGKKIGSKWGYQSSDFDCNISAIKNCNLISLENIKPKLDIYFRNNKREEVKLLAQSFEEIIKHFTELLGVESDINGTFDIIITNLDESGYCRKELIVLSDLFSDRMNTDGFLAHECGHIWSMGADANSWEDWLNETFAEVLSLNFIKKKYEIEAYMERINYIRGIAEKSPQIKSENGERPEGVHFKGTYLMHRLSEKFGEDKMIEVTKLFVKSEEKTTRALLNDVKESIGEDIARFIEDNLIEN